MGRQYDSWAENQLSENGSFPRLTGLAGDGVVRVEILEGRRQGILLANVCTRKKYVSKFMNAKMLWLSSLVITKHILVFCIFNPLVECFLQHLKLLRLQMSCREIESHQAGFYLSTTNFIYNN